MSEASEAHAAEAAQRAALAAFQIYLKAVTKVITTEPKANSALILDKMSDGAIILDANLFTTSRKLPLNIDDRLARIKRALETNEIAEIGKSVWPNIFRDNFANYSTVQNTRTRALEAFAALDEPAAAGAAVEIAVSGNGWRELTPADFELPADDEAGLAALRNFLRGSRLEPLWAAGRLAVPREDVLDVLMDSARETHVILLHGPVGDGKTAALHQLAARWLDSGRQVFQVTSEDALRNPSFDEALHWSEQPLILMDDQVPESPAPSRFVPMPGRTGGCLVITLQTRQLPAAKRLLQSTRPIPIKLAAVVPAVAPPYVDLIDRSGAGKPGLSREDVERLFVGGLRGGLGGLWPAAWQATRGRRLDQRIRELVDALANDKSVLRAVAAIVFINWHCEPAVAGRDTLTIEPKRSTVEALLRASPILDEAIAAGLAVLSSIGEHIDGELLGMHLDEARDPVLVFRHAAVTDAFYRWIFGAPTGQPGQQRRSPWTYYVSLAQALSGQRDAAGNILRLMRMRRRAWNSLDGAVQAVYGDALPLETKKFADLALANRPGADATDRINIEQAHMAFAAAMLGDSDNSFAIERLQAAICDPYCPPDVLQAASELLKTYQIMLPQRGGEPPIDWRDLAQMAVTRLKTRGNAGSAALGALALLVREPPIDPNNLKAHLRRARLEVNKVDAGVLSMLSHIARFFAEPGRDTDFANGPADDSLETARSLFRFFWKSLWLRDDLQRLVADEAGSMRSKQISIPSRAILDGWAALDCEGDKHWPPGVMAEVLRIHDQQTQWCGFFRSYPPFFPV